MDPVRALQHALYRAAKADPGRRFHSLWDRSFAGMSWSGRGKTCAATAAQRVLTVSPFADVEEYGVSRLLDEVAAALREGRWRPLPARRVFIPKPGSLERRPLSFLRSRTGLRPR
jgi:RNA-directed DNA polymerase